MGFLTMIIIVFPMILNAQNSFPTSDAIWNENYFHTWADASNQYMMYGLSGDTIINETSYNTI